MRAVESLLEVRMVLVVRLGMRDVPSIRCYKVVDSRLEGIHLPHSMVQDQDGHSRLHDRQAVLGFRMPVVEELD